MTAPFAQSCETSYGTTSPMLLPVLEVVGDRDHDVAGDLAGLGHAPDGVVEQHVAPVDRVDLRVFAAEDLVVLRRVDHRVGGGVVPAAVAAHGMPDAAGRRLLAGRRAVEEVQLAARARSRSG